jgi:imidazolonepropionase-like amidohydrolase
MRSLIVAFTVFAGLHAQPADPGSAITGVSVIDVANGKTVPDQTVLIRGARIAGVGAAGSVAVPSGAKSLDGRGFYLIPGLWDMHVHFRSNPVDRYKPLAEENAALLDLFVINGVVGVREMGGDLSDGETRSAPEIA